MPTVLLSASSPFLRPVSWKILKDWNEPKRLLGILGLSLNSCTTLTVTRMIIIHENASCVIEIQFIAAWWILSSFACVNPRFLIAYMCMCLFWMLFRTSCNIFLVPSLISLTHVYFIFILKSRKTSVRTIHASIMSKLKEE